MAQHDYVIANGTGAAVRSDLNNALAAIVSQNSGATAPATTYAYQWWADTTTGLLKLRNAANNAWITLFQLDGEWSTLAVENGSAAAPSIYFKDSGTDTGIYSPGADQVAVATNGSGRLFINSSGSVGIGTSSPVFLTDILSGTANTGANVNNPSQLSVTGPNKSLTAGGATVFINSNSDLAVDTGGSIALSGRNTTSSTNSVVWGVVKGAKENATSGNTAGYLTFASTNHAVGGLVEAMRIDSSQRVGIGTTSPSALLNVSVTGAANASTTDALILNNDNTNTGDNLTTGISWMRTGNSGSNIYTRIASIRRGTHDTDLAFSVNNGGTLSERARLTSSGQLLVGTSSSPTAGGGQYARIVVQGYTGGATGAGDFSIQRGELAAGTPINSDIGIIRFNGSDGYTFGQIGCAADAATGTNDYPGRLVFSVTSDGSASPTERARLASTGEWLVYSSGSDTLVAGNAAGSGTAQSLFTGVHTRTSTTGGGTVAYRIYNNGTTFSISDARQKKNVETARDGYLEDLQQLRVVKYNWIDQADTESKELGLLAQEVAQVFPGLVQSADPSDPESTLGIKSSVFSFMLIKALQEAGEKIEVLETRLAALEAQ